MKTSNITFVIQGPVSNPEMGCFLACAVRGLRRLFDGCEIVLASWKGQEESLQYIDVDVVTYLADPGDLESGAQLLNPFRFRNRNTRRMLVSSFAGLELATRDYCVKLRTDSRLVGTGLLAQLQFIEENQCDCLGRGSGRPTGWMLVADAFSRDPRRSGLFCHLSDIFLCGRRSDLRILFKEALEMLAAKEAEGDLPWLCPEQFLWAPFTSEDGQYGLSHALHFAPKNGIRFEQLIARCIRIVAAEQIGLEFSKQFSTGRSDCYSPADLERYSRVAGRHPKYFAAQFFVKALWANWCVKTSLLARGARERLLGA